MNGSLLRLVDSGLKAFGPNPYMRFFKNLFVPWRNVVDFYMPASDPRPIEDGPFCWCGRMEE